MNKVVIVLVMLMIASIVSFAQEDKDGTGRDEFPRRDIIVTAQDHFDLAAVYRRRAASYRVQADDHRYMKEVYRKSREKSPDSMLESWETMEQHCDAIIRQLEGAAVMMDQQAEWHEQRGALITPIELSGISAQGWKK